MDLVGELFGDDDDLFGDQKHEEDKEAEHPDEDEHDREDERMRGAGEARVKFNADEAQTKLSDDQLKIVCTNAPTDLLRLFICLPAGPVSGCHHHDRA